MWDALANICIWFNAFFAPFGGVFVGRWLREKRLARKAARHHDTITPEVGGHIPASTVEWDNRQPLSRVSAQILNAYQSLPESSQTYGDIRETLLALDTKHDRHMLNAHFYIPPWSDKITGRHQHKDCIGAEHYALWKAVMDVKKAINEKEKAIELAGIEHELGQVPTLLEALKIEAEANRP